MVTNIHNPNRHQDADLQVRVSIALTLRQRRSLREINLEVADGVVQLEGNLPSYYDRQLALETARHVAGVRKVLDNLRVVDGLYGKADRFQVTHERDLLSAAN